MDQGLLVGGCMEGFGWVMTCFPQGLPDHLAEAVAGVVVALVAQVQCVLAL